MLQRAPSTDIINGCGYAPHEALDGIQYSEFCCYLSGKSRKEAVLLLQADYSNNNRRERFVTMAITEVFPNPTVTGVHFEIRFPSLFFIEQRIGDFQTKIMDKFPESSLVLRRRVIFADIGPEGKLEPPPGDTTAITKMWNFKSGTGVELNVLSDSLALHSTRHKTYNNPNSDERFRDIIACVTESFFQIAPIPVISRLGLRYIDECPVLKKENKTFQKWYKTTFPLSRFNLADAREMVFRATVSKKGHFIRFMESLYCKNATDILVLDFDGFAEKVKSGDCLAVTDKLHKLISDEFEASIRDPVYKFMRKR